ncbi:efflux RND transporter periplasmic adaptor subunit [Lactococcus garvieae]|uniref:Periplasmic component of ABC transporter n=2 Tax=Lactococcus TaxID=1357 RepID=K2PYL1_9LACT|nr:HlyD family efflux transporter periplasmic adaptor subunit [Lactococcus garvieae]EKF52511.1 Periplasmic component of ABC transporter [Lactococcus garvieae DCC43]
MKRNKKILCVVGGILFLLVTISIILYKISNISEENTKAYNIIEIKKTDPLILKGIVQPKDTSYFNLEPGLGKISNISVQSGQVVNKGDVIATYQNTTIEDQANEQIQSLEKLNLAVSNAQTNVNNAKQKQEELEKQLVSVQNEQSLIKNKKISNEEKQAEKADIDAKVESIKQALDAQKDAVLQAIQMLDNANIDLSSTNNSIEQTKKKIITTITSPFKGIVYINNKGELDNSVPYATVVSQETVIRGTVSEYDYSKIREGQMVKINVTADDKSVDGTITSISELPEGLDTNEGSSGQSDKNMISSFSFLITPKTAIHYGFNVQINVPTNKIEVSKHNIVEKGTGKFVFIYSGGKVHKKKVEVQEESEKYILKSGIKENDKIIDTPDAELKDGQEVVVR